MAEIEKEKVVRDGVKQKEKQKEKKFVIMEHTTLRHFDSQTVTGLKYILQHGVQCAMYNVHWSRIGIWYRADLSWNELSGVNWMRRNWTNLRSRYCNCFLRYPSHNCCTACSFDPFFWCLFIFFSILFLFFFSPDLSSSKRTTDRLSKRTKTKKQFLTAQNRNVKCSLSATNANEKKKKKMKKKSEAKRKK